MNGNSYKLKKSLSAGIMWKENFKKLMFSTDPEIKDIEKAFELKYSHIPTSLFKYRPFDSKNHSLNILKYDVLHLSDPTKFNDPFDCSLSVSVEKLGNTFFIKDMDKIIKESDSKSKISKEEKEKLKISQNFIYDHSKLLAEKYPIKKDTGDYFKSDEIAEVMTKIINKELSEIYSFFPKVLKNTRVTCFSEDNESILMWSHYSDHHKGLCIEYNFKEIGNNDFRTRLLSPVFYEDEIFNATKYIENFIKHVPRIKNKLNPSRATSKFNIFMYNYAALVKAKEWSYEKEWRHVIGYGIDIKFLQTPKPKSIYLGAKVLKENKNEVLKIARKRNFNVYQMQMDESKFTLNPKKLL